MVKVTHQSVDDDLRGYGNIQTGLEELESSLAESTTKISNRDLKNKLYKKSIFKQLPLMFPDYQSIVTQEGSTYIYPQSFTIDWENKEIFVLYSTSGGSSTKRWVVVFNLDTQAYKSCFNAGNAGGEGIVIKKEGADRYLYVKTTGKSLGKFLLNTLPANKTTITPESTYDVGLFYNFSYRNGLWMVEQDNASVGTNIRRTSFSFYDDSFQLKGTTSISTGDGGFWTGNYVNYIPKRQGIALGDGFVVQSTGGYYGKGTTPIPYNYHGIKILNVKGQLVSEGIIDPSLMIPMLEAKGIVCGRIEGEGVHVSPTGDIYSIMIHQDRFMSEANTTGIIIFKELSEDGNAFDFSSAGKVYTGFNPTLFETGVFPRSGDGKMYDPLTGGLLDTFDKILDFMVGTDLRRFSFYGSSATVTDITGSAVPSGVLVKIYNANGSTFFVEYIGTANTRRYIITGSSGSRSQTQLFSSYTVKTPTLLNSTTAFDSSRTPKVLIKPDGTRELVGMVSNAPHDGTLEILLLDSSDRPVRNWQAIVPLTSSTSGGYGTVSVLSSGKVIINFTSNGTSTVSLDGVRWTLTE